MNLISEDYLMHYGVKGMKWGVRKDPNPNYSSEQQRRDYRVYGKSGVRRINKNMNMGDSISGARSRESNRINSARRKARVGGQVGAVAGSISGAIGGMYASKFVSQYMNKKMPGLMDDPGTQMAVKLAVSGGAAKVGQQLGRYGGQSIGMLTSGYNPKRFR